ncbi:Uncharacterised protein [Klebsiella pneumoniae]|uniref:Uncharacterized protein n=1 Tax=Klebsiella pneumoniae TaxID=573 RepID=A0A377X4Q9_KLEPN|nr:Uncharacterised protein [Klebsiella pneumoniae]STV64628.1 Uncharacterised protein [Klebsiella pneumoniae subsp. rhinoscleromatis]STT81864.1 Uncharacterised protein [Klebsiella pneumoniae]STU10437.1 Uncharacterised protein [Klebsiella pneumoniae]STW03482.1 Uncharacterised protein [Klebsiella pneumoniae subsp. rhinoscleromatis]
MSVNIVSTVIDGLVLFVTSPVFWLAFVGWLVILSPAILRSKFSPLQKVNKKNE